MHWRHTLFFTSGERSAILISQQNAQLKSILPLNSIAQFEQLRSRLDSGEYDNAISRLSPLFSPNAITARTVARDFLSRLAINELSRPIDIVDKCGFAIACDLSTSTLDRYATLHEPHISDIENLIHLIEKYIDDRSITRPLIFFCWPRRVRENRTLLNAWLGD